MRKKGVILPGGIKSSSNTFLRKRLDAVLVEANNKIIQHKENSYPICTKCNRLIRDKFIYMKDSEQGHEYCISEPTHTVENIVLTLKCDDTTELQSALSSNKTMTKKVLYEYITVT